MKIFKHIYKYYDKYLGEKILPHLEILKHNEKLSKEELNNLVLQKLKTLIKHARENSQYYKNLFAAHGITEDEIRSLQDLKKIPITTKDMVKRSAEIMVSQNLADRIMESFTTGGAGIPLKFYTDLHKEFMIELNRTRGRSWLGVDFDSHILGFRYRKKINPLKAGFIFRRNIRDIQINRDIILDDKIIVRYLNFMNKFQPELIYSRPSFLYILADYIINKNFPLVLKDLKYLVYTSEMLVPNERKYIEKAFKTKVVEEYSAFDGGFLGHSCKFENLHIPLDHVILEVIDIKTGKLIPAHETQEGEIIVTNLDGYGMPLIRYKIEDVGKIFYKDCACGLPFPYLKLTAASSADLLYDENKKPINGLRLMSAFAKIDGIKKFTIIQKKDLNIKINIVKDPFFEYQNIDLIINKFKKVLGAKIDLEIDFITDLEASEEKFKWIKSEVDIT